MILILKTQSKYFLIVLWIKLIKILVYSKI